MAAERRAKAHLGREHPFAVWQLADNCRFRRVQSNRGRYEGKILRKSQTEIRFGQTGACRCNTNSVQRDTKRIIVVVVFVRIRMTVRGLSLGCKGGVVRVGMAAQAIYRTNRQRCYPNTY